MTDKIQSIIFRLILILNFFNTNVFEELEHERLTVTRFFYEGVWKHEIVAGLGLTLKPFVGNPSCFKVYECAYV